MKRLIYILISFIISCNSYKLAENRTSLDYLYPLDSLRKPKVFIFQTTDSLDLRSFHFAQLIEKYNKRILINSTIGKGNWLDSSIYEIINNKEVLIEKYLKFNDKGKSMVIKGEILENIDNESNNEWKVKYNNGGIITLVTNTTLSDSIIVYKYNGKELDCKRTISKTSISISDNTDSLMVKTAERTIETINAKGIGTISTSIIDESGKKAGTLILKEVIDFEDFKFE